MLLSRRDFLREGTAATAAALVPAGAFDVWVRPPATAARRLVVLHLRGGNDALSLLVPFTDPFYYRRRPTLAVPAARVLGIGRDRDGRPLGLHPALTGLRGIYERGGLAIVQRVGSANASRSHLEAAAEWTAPWTALRSGRGDAASPREARGISRSGDEGYPGTRLGRALRETADSVAGRIGPDVRVVEMAGYDTHADQGSTAGPYSALMSGLDAGLSVFRADLLRRGLMDDTLVLVFSEFGRSVDENAEHGTGHGSAGLMLAMGGGVQGGIYGTAAPLDPDARNPGLENGGRDVRHETDFRGVFASALQWLGLDPIGPLGGDYRSAAPAFV